MMRINLASEPNFSKIIKRVEPGYKKREAAFSVRDTITLEGTYWDGGSRSTYTAINLQTLQTSAAEQFAPPQFGGPRHAPAVTIPDGVAIVETGIFCGKPATARVYVNSRTVSPLLPAIS